MPIGGYVHYYMKHVEVNDLSNILSEQKQALRDEATILNSQVNDDDNFTKLQEQLNLLWSLFSGSNKNSDNTTQIVMDILREKFGENIIKALDINLATGSVLPKGEDTGIATFNEGQSYKISTLTNRIAALQTKAAAILGKAKQLEGLTPSITISELAMAAQKVISDNMMSITNELRTYLDKYASDTNGAATKLQSTLNIVQKRLTSGKKTSTGFYKNRQEQELREFLNQCINIIAPLAAYQQVQGALFEAVLALCGVTVNGMANEEIAKLIRDRVTGNNVLTSVHEITENNKDTLPRKGTKYTNTQNGISYQVTGGTSQRKVDVTLTLNKTNYNINAKSYKLDSIGNGKSGYKNFIKTVSQSPLTILMEENTGDFTTTYANIFSKHYDRPFGEDTSSKVLSQQRKQCLQMLKLTAAVRSIAGFDTRASFKGGDTSPTFVNDQANVFIINDANTGTIRAIKMGDIINKLCDSVDLEGNNGNYTTSGAISMKIAGGSGIKNMVVDNTWEKSQTGDDRLAAAKQRTVAVWAGLEEKKLTMSININSILK